MGALKNLSPIAMLAGSGKKSSPKPTVTPLAETQQNTAELTDAEYRMNTGRKRAKLESSLIPNQTNILGG